MIKNNKKPIFLGVAAALALSTGFLVVGWFMQAGAVPQWYSPSKNAGSSQVNPYITHQLLPTVHNKVQYGEPFEVQIDQHGVNDMMAQYFKPVGVDGMMFENPAVAFKNDRLFLAGMVKRSGLDLIVTVIFHPRLLRDGKIALEMQDVIIGQSSAPFLKDDIRDALGRGVGNMFSSQDMSKMLVDMINSKPIDPAFNMAGYKVRITGIKITNGNMTVLMNPQEK